MKKWLRILSKSRFPYEPLINVNVSRSRLLHNLKQFRNIAPNSQVAPVLKSNAYGHGLMEVADILGSENVPFLVVDSFFEALALRANAIKTPLLIIGYTRPDTVVDSTLTDVSFTITSLDMFRSIASLSSRRQRWQRHNQISLHIKIDTGMRRQGILGHEYETAVDIVRNNRHLHLDGLATHFADADNDDATFTNGQIREWNGAVKYFRKQFPDIKYFHASNTDGHRFTDKIDANVSRLGIGLYGLADSDVMKLFDLKPVMSVETIITGVKTLKNGDSVGYGRTFVAKNDRRIVTIPFGYFEGLDRRLSNRGIVQVGQGRLPCPIIGRISMNIATIDVSSITDVEVGDIVTVFSRNQDDPNSLRKIADTTGALTYELCVHIPPHLKRRVVA